MSSCVFLCYIKFIKCEKIFKILDSMVKHRCNAKYQTKNYTKILLLFAFSMLLYVQKNVQLIKWYNNHTLVDYMSVTCVFMFNVNKCCTFDRILMLKMYVPDIKWNDLLLKKILYKILQLYYTVKIIQSKNWMFRLDFTGSQKYKPCSIYTS